MGVVDRDSFFSKVIRQKLNVILWLEFKPCNSPVRLKLRQGDFNPFLI